MEVTVRVQDEARSPLVAKADDTPRMKCKGQITEEEKRAFDVTSETLNRLSQLIQLVMAASIVVLGFVCSTDSTLNFKVHEHPSVPILLLLASFGGLVALSTVYLYQWVLWQDLAIPPLHGSRLRTWIRGWGPSFATIAVRAWISMMLFFLFAIAILVSVAIASPECSSFGHCHHSVRRHS
jgi:hypothetical protein